MILRQSTAVDVLIGPFVDLTNGYTSEAGESPSVKLSKNGQALAAKSDVTTPVHDADGYYNCELDATDTNTVGTLVLTVAASANALPVRHEFQIVEEATYDFLYAAGATPIADINVEVDTGISDASLATAAALATVDTNVDAILVDTGTTIPAQISGLNDLSAAQVNAEVDTAITDSALVANLATVDAIVDAIKAKTDSLTFTVAGQVDANIQYVNDTIVTGAGTAGDPWGP